MVFLVHRFKAQKHVNESLPAPSGMSQKFRKWKNGLSGQLPEFQVFDLMKRIAPAQQTEN